MGLTDKNTNIINEQKETIYRVNISLDKTEAYLSIFPKMNMPFEISPMDLKSKINSFGVTYGIKFPVLNEICKTLSLSGEPIEDILVSSGIQPINGKDANIELVVNVSLKSIGKQKEDGSIDYKQKESIVKVKKGQIIAYYYKETPGIDGVAVDGSVLKAKSGKHLNIKSENIIFYENDSLFKACEEGQLVVKKDYLGVLTIREIEGDVDLNVGCVDFPGTVLIKGSVLPDFYVKSKGDVFVKGNVTDSLIECAGILNVGEGITGSHKTFIEAGGNVTASYIQNSKVNSAESIVVRKLAYSSNLTATEKIIVEGMVIGGLLSAGKEIIVKDIGSEVGTETFLEVGIEHSINLQIKELNTQISFCQKNIDKIELSLGESVCKLSKDLIPDIFKDQADEILKIIDILNQLKERKQILEEEKRILTEKIILPHPSFIKVRGTIYPITRISIKGKKLIIEEPLKFVKFFYDEKEDSVKWTSL